MSCIPCTLQLNVERYSEPDTMLSRNQKCTLFQALTRRLDKNSFQIHNVGIVGPVL